MGIHVLIAEDEPHIVESLTFVLGREGLDVTSVSDGEAALAHLQAGAPVDVLLLDLMLPRRNGFEVLKALRADSRCRGLPVIVLSAKAQAHDRAQAAELGADAYIAKPFANREVVDQVRRLASR